MEVFGQIAAPHPNFLRPNPAYILIELAKFFKTKPK
jgi:hypothetical protein